MAGAGAGAIVLVVAGTVVDRAHGREAVAPEREPFELPPVRRRLGAGRDETGAEGTGIGKAHAGAEPRRAGLAVDRPQHRPAPARRHQREGDRFGRLSRRWPRGISRSRPLAA